MRGAGADEVLMAWEGSAAAGTDRHYYVADERGSIIAVTGYGGGLEQVGAYDEYGVPRAGFTARFGYTGQTWFPSAGLYKARMYSATLGRFLQTDPIGYADGLNWYNYFGNEPVNFVDPWAAGEIEVKEPIAPYPYTAGTDIEVHTNYQFRCIAVGGDGGGASTVGPRRQRRGAAKERD